MTDDTTPDEVQITDDMPPEAELDRELADDVDESIEAVSKVIALDSDRQMATPFGQMTEADLLDLIRPSLWQWVASKRETALQAIALIHRMSGDVLDKHSESDASELAEEALDP